MSGKPNPSGLVERTGQLAEVRVRDVPRCSADASASEAADYSTWDGADDSERQACEAAEHYTNRSTYPGAGFEGVAGGKSNRVDLDTATRGWCGQGLCGGDGRATEHQHDGGDDCYYGFH